MNYWHHVESAAGMSTAYAWVLLGGILAALLMHVVRPGHTRRLRAAVLLILFSFVGMLVCGFLQEREILDESAAGYRIIHCLSQLSLGVGLANVVAVFLFRIFLPMIRMEPAPILRDTLLGIFYFGLMFGLLSRHDVNLSGIIATSAVVTAVIGFSLQDTLGNIMGGAALQLEQSIVAGDWIRLGDVEGVVREIRWRQASIETRNGDTVVIPNGVLMKSQVTVLGRRLGKPHLHRMTVTFNADFRFSPATVIEVIERALRAEPIPNVAMDPPPDCVMQDFGESYGVYAVRYWLIDFARDLPTSSEVRTRLFFALQRAGIALSMPAERVFMSLESRSQEQRKRDEELHRRVDALKQIHLFSPLSDAERADLAARLTPAPFRLGEVITRQGAEAHYLYIIAKGQVKIMVSSNGDTCEVSRVEAGDVVGEMGLLTGATRTATVIATSDVLCYMLQKDAFQDVLNRRPDLAEALAHLLSQRRADLNAKIANMSQVAVHSVSHDTEGELAQRIRRFFLLE